MRPKACANLGGHRFPQRSLPGPHASPAAREQDPSLPAHLRFGHELDEQCEPGLYMGAATATGVTREGDVFDNNEI
jgi:hypothetical protein